MFDKSKKFLSDYNNLLDSDFFDKYQKQLVWLSNTKIGRIFFKLNKICPSDKKIIKITPNSYAISLGVVYDFKLNRLVNKIKHDFYTIPRFSIQFNLIFSWLPFYYRKIKIDGGLVLTPKFGLTTYAFYPDDTAIDIQARHIASGSTWSTIRNGTGIWGSGGRRLSGSRPMALQVTRYSIDGRYIEWERSIFHFDTSSLPDGDTIQSASLSIYGSEKHNSLAETDFVIVPFTSTSYATSSDGNCGDIGNFNTGSGDICGSISYSSYSTTSYNEISLTAAGISNISKTGISRFGALTDRDRANSQPTWIASSIMGYYGYYSGETGTDKDPKLSVIYNSAYTINLTDSVSLSASLLKQSQRTFSQDIAVSSSMIKTQGKVMSQSISLISSMIRDSFITLSQAISISSVFIRRISKQFPEYIVISDVIEKVNIYFKALSETITISAQFIIKQTVKAFNETISASGNMLISSFKTLAESMAVIDSFIKASGKVLSEAVAISANMIKQAYLTVSETISLVASFLSSASFYKTFSEALSVADSSLRTVGRVLSERVAISASMVKNMVRTLSETVSVVATMLRLRFKEYSETITITDTLSKLIGRTLQESLSLVSKLIIKLNGFVTNFWGRGRRNEGSWGKGGRNIGDWTRKNRN